MYDWNRVRKFVFQESRRVGGGVEDVMAALERLVPLLGTRQIGRQEINRLATALIRTDCAPEIVTPCCPDYTHENGKYTFRGLRGGVSLLTSLHIPFVAQVAQILPKARVTILIADQEADDKELCRVCGKTREEFRDLIYQSIAKTQEVVIAQGWQVRAFTEFMPELLDQEKVISTELLADPMLQSRLRSETFSRVVMYRRIGAMSHDEMMARTARTAAQYLAVGRKVLSVSGILVNHTTTNLAWYADAGVAVLNNPISVY